MLPRLMVRPSHGFGWVVSLLAAACGDAASPAARGTGGLGARGGSANGDAAISDTGGAGSAEAGARDSGAQADVAPGGGKGGIAGSSGGTGVEEGTAGGAGGMGGVRPGDTMVAQPSPGCRLANGQPPERTTEATFGLEVVRKFPPAYDGVTPMPLIFALHATNFTATSAVMNLVKDQPMAARYVVVAPHEKPDIPSNFEVRQPADFSQMMANILGQLCVDQQRIFAVGNGSGGRALVRWTGYLAHATAAPAVPPLRAFAMVGTYIAGNPGPDPVTTIFIHPLTSNNSRSVGDEDGSKALAAFRKRNQCGETSVPVAAASCLAGGMPVNPGCVDFEGCALPFRFCQHDDLTNQSSGDPWTCMASPAIYQFFERFL